MNNYFNSFKTLFHLTNFVFIILYIYPGSLLGWIIFNDVSKQPQITRDFIISSNHFYAFIIVTSLGVISFHNTKKISSVSLYLISLSITLELFHIFIPNREFEMIDLYGNIAGVILAILIYKIIIKYVKT